MSGPSDEPQSAPSYPAFPPPNYPYASTYPEYPLPPDYSRPLNDAPPTPYPGQPMYPPPPGYSPYPMMAESPTSAWAIASLVCSLANVANVATGFSAILGVIFGHMALAEIRRNPRVRGRGMAIAGLVIGYLILAFYALIPLISLVAIVGLGRAYPG